VERELPRKGATLSSLDPVTKWQPHLRSVTTRLYEFFDQTGYRVTWRLRARKFFCRKATCSRRIFTERLPGVAGPWGGGPCG
jgi:hypothetical protein